MDVTAFRTGTARNDALCLGGAKFLLQCTNSVCTDSFDHLPILVNSRMTNPSGGRPPLRRYGGLVSHHRNPAFDRLYLLLGPGPSNSNEEYAFKL